MKKYHGPGGDVVIPEGVTSIGDSAFRHCSSLTSVTIPASVTSIGNWAFKSCASLTSVTIPDSVRKIGLDAFFGCTGLTSIGVEAFSGCASLTSVTIPESVRKIGRGVFSDCTSLTSVTIRGGVWRTAGGAFRGCTSLQDEQGLVIVGGVLYDYLNKKATKATVPEGVWRVEDYVFSDRSGLCVTLPSSVCNVGLNVFKGCAAVKGGRNDMEDSNVYHALGGDKGVKAFLEGRLLLDGAIKKWLIAYIKRKKKDFAAAYIDGNDVDAMRSFLALWEKAPWRMWTAISHRPVPREERNLPPYS